MATSGDIKRMTVRAIEALAVFAADLEPLAYADVHDSIASLLDACWSASPDARELARWALDAEQIVRRCMGDAPNAHALHALAQVVRMQALVPRPTQSVLPSASTAAADAPSRPRSSAPRSGVKKLPSRMTPILTFIRAQNGCRSKQVIDHFAGTLSPRSVKRFLNELVAAGSLARLVVEGITRYEPIDAKG